MCMCSCVYALCIMFCACMCYRYAYVLCLCCGMCAGVLHVCTMCHILHAFIHMLCVSCCVHVCCHALSCVQGANGMCAWEGKHYFLLPPDDHSCLYQSICFSAFPRREIQLSTVPPASSPPRHLVPPDWVAEKALWSAVQTRFLTGAIEGVKVKAVWVRHGWSTTDGGGWRVGRGYG